MKLITAIVNRKDSAGVCEVLAEKKVAFTKMASIGGFLKAGNITLLIGVDEKKVYDVIELIRKNCRTRKVAAPESVTAENDAAEVTVGGAIVFVTDVERFEKM